MTPELLSKSAKGFAIFASALALAGCAKSVDHYVENSPEREAMLTECVGKGLGVAMLSGSTEGLPAGCKNALEAQHKIEAAAAAKAAVERKAQEAAQAAEAAKKQKEQEAIAAQQKLDREAAETKFKEVETTERASFDAAEKLISDFSNTDIQNRLNKYASELNKGNAKAAAAALLVDPVLVYSAAQSAVITGGITGTRLDKFNAVPGDFKFALKYPDYQKLQPPTGYDVQAKHTALDTHVTLIAARSSDKYVYGVPAYNAQKTSCFTFNYGIGIDGTTGQPKGVISNFQENSSCSR